MTADGKTASGTGQITRRARLKTWFLLDGPRKVVAGITALSLLLFFLAVSVSRFDPLGDLEPLYYVLGGLIGGNLTIITVVVSINQLLLSQEMGTPSELRSEIDGILDYRREIEEFTGEVPPVEPLGFLRLLLETTRQRAQHLGGLSVSETSEDVSGELDSVVTRVTDQMDRVDSVLRETDVGTFQVLSVMLNTNYAGEIRTLRQLHASHGDDLPEDVQESIQECIHLLQSLDIARQYFKSIYLQQELATLSRLLFYSGLPSIGIVAATFFAFTAPGGASVHPAVLRLLIPIVVTIGLVPLSILFSFILRSATVARRTAAVVPFTTPEQEEQK